MERVFNHLQDRVEVPDQESLSLEEIHARGMTDHVEFFTENPRCWRVLVIGRKEDHFAPLCDTMLAHRALMEGIMMWIREENRRGDFREVDPEYAAFALMAMAATVVEKHFHQDTDTRQEDINSALDIYLRGIGK